VEVDYRTASRQKERKMRTRILLVALAALGMAVALTAIPAAAEVPGANGRILYGVVDPNLGDTVIYTANPDGSQAKQMVPGPPAASLSECPDWSPDGTQIATCDGPGSAVIFNAEDGSSRVVPEPDPANLFLPCSTWTPDGQRLTCEGFGNDPSLNGIYTIRASDGGGLKRITANPGGDDQPGDYSPDGTQLVFLRNDPARPACPPRLFWKCPTPNSALFVVNVASGALRQLTPWGLAIGNGSWSPDGTKILFPGGASRLSDAGSLYVVHPDGSGLARITLTGTNSNWGVQGAAWSPDGTKILLELKSPTTGDEEVFTANADGSGLQQVTTNAHDVAWLDWGTHPLIK
jgi:Tol biopolymer transport system component